MKKIAELAKFTHRFADTCCYTNLKSKILNKARCGVDLSPPAKRKRKRCPVERNDVKHCPKCKQINDTIWTAHNNTGLWVNDDALEWFETQQDSRRRKHVIYEEYMSRPDAPMIVYSSEGVKFIPPPTVPKKEKKHRLDAKNFKRISPEFLRLLQRHQDIVLKNESTRYEHESDIETETPVTTLARKKAPAKPRASYYLRGLKKINFKSVEKVPSTHSKTSFNKKTYFKKKRQPNQVRSKAGKEQNSSSATHLQTLYTYYPNSSSNKSLRSASGHISLNRQRGGNEVNCNMSNIRSLTASYQLDPTFKAPLQARRDLIKIIRPKPLNLNKVGCSKALATNSLCNCAASLASSNSLRHVNDSLPSTSNAISRTHKCRYRRKDIESLKKPLCQMYDRNRGGKHIESVNKSSIPLSGSYLLATVGDPFETKAMTPSYCQFRDGHLQSFNSESTLKAIDSNMPTPESSCYILSTIGDLFEAKTPKHSFCHLGTNTRNIKSLTPIYSYTSFAPSTSSVQTQTHCSNERDNVAKSTQTLLMGQQSFSCLEMSSPTSSTLCIDDTSKDNIIVKPNPSATRRPNHHYPRI